jgi:hypothetical protein
MRRHAVRHPPQESTGLMADYFVGHESISPEVRTNWITSRHHSINRTYNVVQRHESIYSRTSDLAGSASGAQRTASNDRCKFPRSHDPHSIPNRADGKGSQKEMTSRKT